MQESYDTSVLLKHYKDNIEKVILNMNPKANQEKLNKRLDQIIQSRIINQKCSIVNNYRGSIISTDILSLFDMIDKTKPIIGGDGVLYAQHEDTFNPLVGYIINLMALRKQYKKTRSKYDEGTDLYNMYDRLQLNTKIKINTLYGVLGYSGFIFFNKYLAQSVTAMGQNIISTATCCFENFLADNSMFQTQNEIYQYINNIITEYTEKYQAMDFSVIPEIPDDALVYRIMKKCAYAPTEKQKLHIETIISNQPVNIKKLLYFKNNLFEFSSIPFIKTKLKYIFDNIGELNAGEMYAVENKDVAKIIDDVWDFYTVFVVYDYTITDRIRKTKYSNKKAAVYTDTDSDFLALDPWVNFIKNDVYEKKYDGDLFRLEANASNVMTIFISKIVNLALTTMARMMNINSEMAKKLNMKNELYFKKIVFTKVKKRYLALPLIREGKVIAPDGNTGWPKPEIKGFDFIKSVTKPSVRKKYENICLYDILGTSEIKTSKILREIAQFKQDIETALRSGDSQYYKQANVAIMDHYKKPYSIQGIKCILLWNALYPEYAMDLPIDVDIIPIKNLSNKKFLTVFKELFPYQYKLLNDNIFSNPNEDIRKMKLNFIAKPKNYDEKLPDWFQFLIDVDKIVTDTLSLFNPVLESLGCKLLKTNASTEHFSNIVQL